MTSFFLIDSLSLEASADLHGLDDHAAARAVQVPRGHPPYRIHGPQLLLERRTRYHMYSFVRTLPIPARKSIVEIPHQPRGKWKDGWPDVRKSTESLYESWDDCNTV